MDFFIAKDEKEIKEIQNYYQKHLESKKDVPYSKIVHKNNNIYYNKEYQESYNAVNEQLKTNFTNQQKERIYNNTIQQKIIKDKLINDFQNPQKVKKLSIYKNFKEAKEKHQEYIQQRKIQKKLDEEAEEKRKEEQIKQRQLDLIRQKELEEEEKGIQIAQKQMMEEEELKKPVLILDNKEEFEIYGAKGSKGKEGYFLKQLFLVLDRSWFKANHNPMADNIVRQFIKDQKLSHLFFECQHNPKLTDLFFMGMNTSFPQNLQYLSMNLSNTPQIKENSVINFIKCLRTNVLNLHTFRLNLENFPNATELLLKNLSSSFFNYDSLRNIYLNFKNNYSIQEDVFIKWLDSIAHFDMESLEFLFSSQKRSLKSKDDIFKTKVQLDKEYAGIIIQPLSDQFVDALTYTIGNYKNLKKFYMELDGCQQITDQSLIKLSKNFGKNLEKLKIFLLNCGADITNQFFNCVQKYNIIWGLKELKIGYSCFSLTDHVMSAHNIIKEMVYDVKGIQKLEIQLEGCHDISDFTMDFFKDALPDTLEDFKIYIQNCRYLSDFGVEKMVKEINHNIKNVNIQFVNCPLITDISLNCISHNIKDQIQNLFVLFGKNCQLSDQGRKQLQIMNQKYKIKDINNVRIQFADVIIKKKKQLNLKQINQEIKIL